MYSICAQIWPPGFCFYMHFKVLSLTFKALNGLGASILQLAHGWIFHETLHHMPIISEPRTFCFYFLVVASCHGHKTERSKMSSPTIALIPSSPFLQALWLPPVHSPGICLNYLPARASQPSTWLLHKGWLRRKYTACCALGIWIAQAGLCGDVEVLFCFNKMQLTFDKLVFTLFNSCAFPPLPI